MGQNFLHAVKADVVIRACPAIERFIACSENLSYSWKTTESDGTKASVGYLQIFSDKSQVPLPTEALHLHWFLVTLLNFSEERHRELITSRRILVAYLPVIFEARHTRPTHKSREAGPRSLSIVDRLRNVHEIVASCLRPPQMVAKAVPSVDTKKGKNFCYIFAVFLCCRQQRNRRPTAYETKSSDIHSVSYFFAK